MASFVDEDTTTTITDVPDLVVEWLPTQGPGAPDGEWCDISRSVTGFSTNRGRQYELDRVQTGRARFDLVATTRLFDPDNTASPFSPWLVPMRQIRISAGWAPQAVTFPGTSGHYASTPDTAAVSITGDLDIRMRVALDDWTPSSENELLAKWNTSGVSQGSFLCGITTAGLMDFQRSSTGADQFPTNYYQSSAAVPALNGTTMWLRWTLDVSNASSQSEVTFYYAPDSPTEPTTWTQLGASDTDANNSNTFDSTALLTFSGYNTGTASPFDGTLYECNLYSGINGTLAASFNAGDAASTSATTITSQRTGEVWTLAGSVAVTTGARTLYPIFRGYITDWGQTVPAADSVFFTSIEARDAFAVLEMIELGSSAWALEIQRTLPSLWFRLGESDTVRVTDSSAGGNYGLYDNVDQGAEGLVPNDADGAVNIGYDYDPADSRVTIQNPSLISGYPFTISMLFRAPTNSSYARLLFAGYQDTSPAKSQALLVYIGFLTDSPVSTGLLVAFIRNGGTQRQVQSSIIVDDDLVHHGTCVFTSASSFSVYVDGVDVSTATSLVGSPTWPGNPATGYTIGNSVDVLFGTFGARAIVDETCVWNGTALDPTTIARQALAARSGWNGDDSGTRVGRFLDALDWPTTLRDISTGVSTLGPASWSAGASALGVMYGWADTELGAFFVGPSGKIVWRNRHYPYLATRAVVSQTVFGDANSTAALKYVADTFEMARDESLIRNPVQAGRTNGVTVRVQDDALISKYGNRSWSAPQSEDQGDAVIRDRATWILTRYKEVGTRLASMSIRPRRDPGRLWAEVLGLELGDRITVKRTPLGLNAEISTDQIIESVAHRYDASSRDWVTTYSASPVDTTVNTYLVLDNATTGLLDSFRLAY